MLIRLQSFPLRSGLLALSFCIGLMANAARSHECEEHFSDLTPSEVSQALELALLPDPMLESKVAQLTTRELANLGRALVILNVRMRAVDSSRFPGRLLVYPEPVLKALLPERKSASHEALHLRYRSLPHEHLLKRFAHHLRSLQSVREISHGGNAAFELYRALNQVNLELSDRPYQERSSLWSVFSRIPEDVLLASVAHESYSFPMFFSPKSPPPPFKEIYLNGYWDAFFGFYGPKVHHEISQKYEGSSNAFGRRKETYMYVGYEGISSSYADFVFLGRELGLAGPVKVVDIGSAYGRVAWFFSRFYPGSSFTGYELVPERVEAARKVLLDNRLEHNARVKNEDVGRKRNELPEADIYYLYEPTSAGDVGPVLDKLAKINQEKSRRIRIVAKPALNILVPLLRKQTWLKETRLVIRNGLLLYHVFEGLDREAKDPLRRSVFPEALAPESIARLEIKDLKRLLEHYTGGASDSPKFTNGKQIEAIQEALLNRMALFAGGYDEVSASELRQFEGPVAGFFRIHPLKQETLVRRYYLILRQFYRNSSTFNSEEFSQVIQGDFPSEAYEEALSSCEIFRFDGKLLSRRLLPLSELPPSRDSGIRERLENLLSSESLHSFLRDSERLHSFGMRSVMEIMTRWELDPIALGYRDHYLEALNGIEASSSMRVNRVFDMLRFLERWVPVEEREIKRRIVSFLELPEVQEQLSKNQYQRDELLRRSRDWKIKSLAAQMPHDDAGGD